MEVKDIHVMQKCERPVECTGYNKIQKDLHFMCI